MGITDSGEPLQGGPQDKAREFDALWELSKLRAEFRRGLSLDEMKYLSSRLRRMARLSTEREHGDGTRHSGPCYWPASSKRAG